MPYDANLQEITAEALAQRIAAADTPLQLIDVREPQEIAIAALPKFQVFPLSQSAQWMTTLPTQLDPLAETYVICHHGMRSAQMCQWLIQQGFTNVKNIAGGIDAYSLVVDPSIPRY
jgi:rhodanese-related sulfurtransferase